MSTTVIPFKELFRAGDRVRTGDIQLGRLTLYQLSYSRICFLKIPRIGIQYVKVFLVYFSKNACKDSDNSLLSKILTQLFYVLKIVGRAGFEPAKVKPTDLQSVLVGRLSISPTQIFIQRTEPVEGLEPTTC